MTWNGLHFLQVVNYNHVLPTRYALDVDLRKVITAESMEKGKRPDARKEVKVCHRIDLNFTAYFVLTLTFCHHR